MFSILIVTSLALFSSHAVTYFAAIFIIATAVTELEFLQNLAAIIRKDENYFNYKKEILTKEENEKRKNIEAIQDEIVALEDINKESNENINTIRLSELQELSRPDSMKLFYQVEEKTIEYLKKLHPTIESGIRIRKDGKSIELDGIVAGKNNAASTIFEIKWIRNEKHVHSLLWHALKQSEYILTKYKDITGTDAQLILILVVNTESSIGPGSIDNIREKADTIDIKVQTINLSTLGYNVQD